MIEAIPRGYAGDAMVAPLIKVIAHDRAHEVARVVVRRAHVPRVLVWTPRPSELSLGLAGGFASEVHSLLHQHAGLHALSSLDPPVHDALRFAPSPSHRFSRAR